MVMAEDESKKEEEKFEFTPEGEALGYISLDQARDNCDEGHCNSLAELLIS